MSRGPLSFKQSDVVRAIKAVRACGLAIVRTEIAPDGRIILVHQGEAAVVEVDEYAIWKAKYDARNASKK